MILGTWFSGGLGSIRLMVGLDELMALIQPKGFYGSMILYLFWEGPSRGRPLVLPVQE